MHNGIFGDTRGQVVSRYRDVCVEISWEEKHL